MKILGLDTFGWHGLRYNGYFKQILRKNHGFAEVRAKSCKNYLPPIENMWAIVQRHVDREVAPDASEDEIWEHVQRVWEEIPISTVNNLVLSLPLRFRECVRVEGATIRTKGAGKNRSRSAA